MENIKQELNGKCAICGKECELSFEHIPPKSTFNDKKVEYITLNQIKEDLFEFTAPWDFEGLKKKILQKGSGYNRLCKNCNSNFGSWYVPQYTEFIIGINNFCSKEQPKTNEVYLVTIVDLKPLPIFKQVISMFCTLNGNIFNDKDLKNFLLNKESNVFNKEKYHLCIYLLTGGIQRHIGITAISIINRENNTYKETIVISELGMYPLGFVLYIGEPPDSYKEKLLDITFFSDYKYNEKDTMSMTIPAYEANNLNPGDFRTKQEIEIQAKKEIECLKKMIIEKETKIIATDFPDNLFDTIFIKECENELRDNGFEVILNIYSNRYINGIEEIFSIITIYISNDIVKSIIAGFIVEIFKKVVIKIYNAIKNKKINIINGEELNENIPSVSIKAKNINILIPIELNEDKFKYCLDKAFESIRDNQELIEKSKTITFYDVDKDLFITKEELSYFKDKYINKDE